jgi:chloramphenicol 3-O-phosphotransferase
MILLLNGAFGIGKTTVARALVARMPNSVLFDPELIGITLQRSGRLLGRKVGDFQDLPSWRRLTIRGLRLTRFGRPNIIVPMAISERSYLAELREGMIRFESRIVHCCLMAPEAIVHARLEQRGADRIRDGWQFRRASECCRIHPDAAFAEHVDTANRTVDEIAAELHRFCR